MSDRLQQLHQQRALLQEHLAWLDREIAAETSHTSATDASAATLEPAPAAQVLTASTAVTAETDATADDILAQYRAETANVQQDVKRGCLLYFGAAFAIVGLGALGLYLYSSSH